MHAGGNTESTSKGNSHDIPYLFSYYLRKITT